MIRRRKRCAGCSVGERDPAEHLHRAVRDLARRRVRRMPWRSTRSGALPDAVVERRGRVTAPSTSRSPAGHRCRRGGAAAPGSSRSCGRTAGARPRSGSACVEDPRGRADRPRRRRAASRPSSAGSSVSPRRELRSSTASAATSASANALPPSAASRRSDCAWLHRRRRQRSAATSASAGSPSSDRDDRELVDGSALLDRDLRRR